MERSGLHEGDVLRDAKTGDPICMAKGANGDCYAAGTDIVLQEDGDGRASGHCGPRCGKEGAVSF